MEEQPQAADAARRRPSELALVAQSVAWLAGTIGIALLLRWWLGGALWIWILVVLLGVPLLLLALIGILLLLNRWLGKHR